MPITDIIEIYNISLFIGKKVFKEEMTAQYLYARVCNV